MYKCALTCGVVELLRSRFTLFCPFINFCMRLYSTNSMTMSQCVFLSRCHIVNEFNRGIYDYIIATDEVHALGGGGATTSSHGNRKRGQKRKRDKEYGVARGIDFQGIMMM